LSEGKYSRKDREEAVGRREQGKGRVWDLADSYNLFEVCENGEGK